MKNLLAVYLAVCASAAFPQTTIKTITHNDMDGYIVMFKKKPVDNAVYQEYYEDDGFIVVTAEENNQKRVGVYSDEGKKIVPVEFDAVHLLGESKTKFVIAEKAGKKILFTMSGSQIDVSGYLEVSNFCGGTSLIETKCGYAGSYRYGFLNLNEGKEAFECRFDSWKSAGQNYVIVGENGKKGIITEKSFLLKPEFDNIESVSDSAIFTVSNAGENLQVFLASEKRTLPGRYSEAQEYWPLLRLILPPTDSANEKIVFYHLEKKKFLYDTVNAHLYNHAFKSTVLIGSDFYEFSNDGQRGNLIPGSWTNVNYVASNLIAARKNEKVYLLDVKGNQVNGALYDEIGYSSKGDKIMTIKAGEKYGVINSSGKEIISPSFDKIEQHYSLPGNWKRTELNGKYGVLNENGKIILEAQYDELKSSDAGILISKNGLYGMVDFKGQTFIPCEYEESFYFSDDLASVKKNSRNFYINKRNKEVTTRK